MIDRRQHRRVEVDFWASMKHPLLGTITCSIEDMSSTGVSIRLDEKIGVFVMMELDIRIHGEGWDPSAPSLPVQVVRVNERRVALKFCESFEHIWDPEPDLDLVSQSFNSARSHQGLLLEMA